MIAADIDKALQRGPGDDVEAARLKVEQMFTNWCLVKAEIATAVYRLPDRRERIVLLNYYCSRMTVKETADDLGMTWRQTHRILKDAIKHLGEALGLE